MKVTIGTLFATYKIAEEIHRGSTEKASKPSGKETDYSQALSARLIISDVLRNCKVEIELSSEIANALIPLSRIVIISALSDETNRIFAE